MLLICYCRVKDKVLHFARSLCEAIPIRIVAGVVRARYVLALTLVVVQFCIGKVLHQSESFLVQASRQFTPLVRLLHITDNFSLYLLLKCKLILLVVLHVNSVLYFSAFVELNLARRNDDDGLMGLSFLYLCSLLYAYVIRLRRPIGEPAIFHLKC